MEHWTQKFRCAFRGVWVGSVGQSSFAVHLVAALVAVSWAIWLGFTPWKWAVLILTISSVVVAELFNSAIEQLAQACTREENPQIRDALDIASGAVLLAAIASLAIGGILLGS